MNFAIIYLQIHYSYYNKKISDSTEYDNYKAFKEQKDKIIQIKLLSENKLIVCAWGNLHYQISREKFEPGMSWQLNQDSSIGRASG